MLLINLRFKLSVFVRQIHMVPIVHPTVDNHAISVGMLYLRKTYRILFAIFVLGVTTVVNVQMLTVNHTVHVRNITGVDAVNYVIHVTTPFTYIMVHNIMVNKSMKTQQDLKIYISFHFMWNNVSIFALIIINKMNASQSIEGNGQNFDQSVYRYRTSLQ